MDIWLDSADINLIKQANKLGILAGVTTNPSIIAKSGKSLEEALKEILQSQRGPVAAQVLASKAEEMVEQAESLRDFSERIVIKIPVTQEGLKAMNSLSHLELPIMATTIITPLQALLACHAGASFLAPYYSHIEESGSFAEDVLDTILDVIESYKFETRLIAASLRDIDQVTACLELGIHGVTVKPELFNNLIADHPATLNQLEKFKKDASEGKPSKLFRS